VAQLDRNLIEDKLIEVKLRDSKSSAVAQLDRSTSAKVIAPTYTSANRRVNRKIKT
jgi:uncharacterized protein YpbB